MHPDLAAHLHSPECNALINELKACHESNTFGRFVGVCNSLDTLVNRCLKKERQRNQSANRAKAIDKQAAYKERMQQSQ